MIELPYSFHLGSNKNRKASSRSSAKNNRSNSTSLANNGIQNYQQLSKINNHDFRKYDNYTKDIYTIKGTNNLVSDVKDLYKDEFEEARLEYNAKQSRPSRMIDNYFEYVSNDEKRDLACEIIIELGNKEYWDSKNEDFKKKMVDVYIENLSYLEKTVPEFKITNAVVHLDETSPHMHIVGVPIKENNKTGLSKQVNKSSVFTKDRLEHIQNVMRENCIKAFNKTYDLDATLKTKEKGRNKDINVNDMGNYIELQKELKNNKESINKNIDKIKSINNSSKELNSLLNDLQESKLGGYRITAKQKERLQNLLKETETLSNYFDNLSNVYNNLSSINENLNFQKERNVELSNNYSKVMKDYHKLEKDYNDLSDSRDFVEEVLKTKNEDHKRLVYLLCKNVNSNDRNISNSFKQVSEKLYEHKVISKAERRVIFYPPKLINQSEVDAAIRHMNQEMEEAAEYFYRQGKKTKDSNSFEI